MLALGIDSHINVNYVRDLNINKTAGLEELFIFLINFLD